MLVPIALAQVALLAFLHAAQPFLIARPPVPARPDTLGRVRFPRDAWVLDAKRDLGAKGDGKTDGCGS